MSIQHKVTQLTNLNTEIKRLYKEISRMKKVQATINKEITDYLIANNEKGFRIGDTALVLDVKNKPFVKTKKNKEESYLNMIEEYGIEDPKRFLEKLIEAGKDTKEVSELKFHKI